MLGTADYVTYVRQHAQQDYGLDPAAVLAVAQQEGLGGESSSLVPGDNGTSFGPHQLHMGGALPPAITALGANAAQAWSWSEEGFKYALQQISGVARGLTGVAAITAITTQFERPSTDYGPTHRNLQREEIANATNVYPIWAAGNSPISNASPSVDVPGGASVAGGGTGVAPTSVLDFGQSVQHVLVEVGLIALAIVLFIGGVYLLASSKR